MKATIWTFATESSLAEETRRIIAWLDQHQGLPKSDDDLFEDRLIAIWQQLGAQMAQALGS